LGPHSYDPGFMAGSLVFWGVRYPLDSGQVDTSGGTAQLFVQNVCSVFDVFTIPNSFDPAHALGIFSAVINSLKIKWSGVTTTFKGFRDPTNQVQGDFFECSATIAVSVTTPVETGHGFHFASDPSKTTTNFAQFGTEQNGVFFT